MAKIQTTSEFNDWFGRLRDKQGRQRISVRISGWHREILGSIFHWAVACRN